MTGIRRVVAIGASNLTRGFQTVVSTARTTWGPDVHVVAALGHGRSYGTRSAFLGRRLPGVLESGLWQHLETMPAVPTRTIVTDVGNDILYGFTADRILEWVDEAVSRLARISEDVTVTDLPMDSIRRLSRPKFYAVRSALAPSCRLSFDDVLSTAERVNSGLEQVAISRRAHLLRLVPSWYGFDPIHIKPSHWQEAWQQILGASPPVQRSRTEALRLYAMRPERQWLFGVEQRTTQAGVRLRRGGRVWLY